MEDVVNHIQLGISENLDERQSFAFARKKGITSRVLDCVVALSVCHNVTPTWDEHNILSYQASSPDEIAIVKWTEQMGLVLVFRDLNTIRVKNSQIEFEYEILETFPFTSESKRMGIVLRNKATQKISFFIKGADIVMAKIVSFNHWLDEECNNMAREGLRTLVIGRKSITEEKYREFEKEYIFT
jgi:phospholipid-translocating ATPase